jgi:excisionase family DNA binding protein
LLSTGKVARVLSVTPDTVLKWIKLGRLPAVRTAGGHYRVAPEDIDRLVGGDEGPDTASEATGFVHCWEYYGTDGTASGRCLDCLVYRAQAIRCYEMSGLEPESGYAGVHCTTSCEECEYYRNVARPSRRVLIVSPSPDLRQRLGEGGADSALELEFASSEYECAAICAEFRPDYVVIDGALSRRTRESLCSHLAADRRIPGVTIVFAIPENGHADSGPDDAPGCTMPRSFDLEELEHHIKGLEVKPRITA